MARNRSRSSMTRSKLRFLGVICAKLRTEVFAVRRPPNFNMAIPKKERLVAERAAGEIAILEVLAARDHRIPLSNSKTARIFCPEKNLAVVKKEIHLSIHGPRLQWKHYDAAV